VRNSLLVEDSGANNYREHLPNVGTTLRHRMVAEFFGTMLLTLFGISSVSNAVLSGAYPGGLWDVAMLWGFGASIAIYVTASVSGAHLNPAVSFALSFMRPADFPFRYLGPYIFAQVMGGIAAGALNLWIFWGSFRSHEALHQYKKGDDVSLLSATCFGEYFPNPNFRYNAQFNGPNLVQNPALMWDDRTVTVFEAFMIETFTTALLVFVIFALTDPKNKVLIGSKDMAPFFIGFTIAVEIGLWAQLTQVGMNPARDLGPRIVAAIAGWGKVALPGPRNEFWLYVVGPMIGGPIGGAIFEFVVGRGLRPNLVKAKERKDQLYATTKVANKAANI